MTLVACETTAPVDNSETLAKLEKMPADVAPIATASVKWNPEYQEKYGITTGPAEDLSANLRDKIERVCKKVYRVLNMSGYARMDLRLTEDNRIFILEANANPNLEYGEDFSESAEVGGIDYEDLLDRILRLGMNYRAPWQS